MGKLSKFENVDVLSSLEAIMRTNTGFFQNDFDIDKRLSQRRRGNLPPRIKRCYGCPDLPGHIAFGSVMFS